MQLFLPPDKQIQAVGLSMRRQEHLVVHVDNVGHRARSRHAHYPHIWKIPVTWKWYLAGVNKANGGMLKFMLIINLIRGQQPRGDRMDDMEEVPEVSEPVEESNVIESHTPLSTSPVLLALPTPEPPTRIRASHSFDSMRIGSETSGDALLRHTLSIEELRSLGDAPPYESSAEMVELGESLSTLRTPQAQPVDFTGAVTPNTFTPNSGPFPMTVIPRSGFRKLISRLMPSPDTYSSALPSASNPTPDASGHETPLRTHTRVGSTTTIASTTLPARSHFRQSTHARSRSQSTTTQLRSRASANSLSLASFSRSSISLNLPRSNTASNSTHPGMPNPTSNISTSSISAPLPHTLVRTNFVYPSSGPTTEQMRFISSVETIGKYGVPYGKAATAARSQELLLAQMAPPPPFNFEDSAGVGTSEGHSSGEADEGNAVEDENMITTVNEEENMATLASGIESQPTSSSHEPDLSPASITSLPHSTGGSRPPSSVQSVPLQAAADRSSVELNPM